MKWIRHSCIIPHSPFIIGSAYAGALTFSGLALTYVEYGRDRRNVHSRGCLCDRPCLCRLREDGRWVGEDGNQGGPGCRVARPVAGDGEATVRRHGEGGGGCGTRHHGHRRRASCGFECLPVFCRLFRPIALTDSRKFVQMGVWRSFARVLLIILHVQFRLPVLPRSFFSDIR